MSPEEQLLRDITKRLRQTILNRMTEAELAEAIHQDIKSLNAKWIASHARKLEQINALKEIVRLMVRDWESEEELINRFQQYEVSAFETMANSRAILHDWNNIQTVLDNMAAMYQTRIYQLELQE